MNKFLVINSLSQKLVHNVHLKNENQRGNKFFLRKKRIQKGCILTYLHGKTKQEFFKWAEKQRKYSSNYVYLIFSFVLNLFFFFTLKE